jgi:DNA-binding NarL/FixJ family response regulator
MLTAVLVDDDGGFRRLARLALAADGVQVIAEATTGDSALQAVLEHGPDVVLLDIGLPDIDGTEVARRLRATAGCRSTIILISSRESGYGRRVAAGCAAGFIRKDRLSSAAIEAIVHHSS